MHYRPFGIRSTLSTVRKKEQQQQKIMQAFRDEEEERHRIPCSRRNIYDRK